MILRDARESRDPVAVVAQRHDISTSCLYAWMKRERIKGATETEAREQAQRPANGFIELKTALVHNTGRTEALDKCQSSALAGPAYVEPVSGRFEIVGANGRRVIVDHGVDVGALLRIMRCVEELR
jgi:transposase-like protein